MIATAAEPRIYDRPQARWIASWQPRSSPPAPATELLAYRDELNPAQLGREIADLQSVLLKLAKDKTEEHYLSTFPTAVPDIRKGIRLTA